MITYVIHPTDEQEKVVRAFLEALGIYFEKEDEKLPEHVLAGIAQGQADVKAGRTMSFEDFKKGMASAK
jgi:hypothetical protein